MPGTEVALKKSTSLIMTNTSLVTEIRSTRHHQYYGYYFMPGETEAQKGAAERELLSPNLLLCLLSDSSKGRASNCPRGRSRRGMDLQGLLAPVGLGLRGWGVVQ